MRTTLDIDDDVLNAAKEIAAVRGSSAGKVLSELARKGLSPVGDGLQASRNGVPVMPSRGAGASRPTMHQVHQLRDDA
jgi:hypothetical protein